MANYMAIDFSPYGFTAKADASDVDLKVHVFYFLRHEFP